MVYTFSEKKSKGTGIKNEINENQQLANELHKPIIRKFKKRKVYPSLHSTHNEGKSAVAEIFIRTLKNKICKHMTAISKNVSFDVLDDVVDEYNNTYHETIKMKPTDAQNDSFAEYSGQSNKRRQIICQMERIQQLI